MFKKLATALVIASAVTTVQLPFSFDVQAAEAKQEKKKKRPTQLVGPSVGKKVQKAFEAGVGNSVTVAIGGSLDQRFTPVQLDCTVDMLSCGHYLSESWGNPTYSGPTAVLKSDNYTIVGTTRSVSLFDRSLFLGHGQNPKHFDLIIVKSPHCQPHFFDDWAEVNYNPDAPGSTSANLKTLGHTICQRPMYPLDENVSFQPEPEIYT